MAEQMMITEAIATKVRDLVDAGLVYGVGTPEPGRMCVEAAVCYALGLPHGDDPGCVSQPLRRLKIRLNDARWSSDAARAKGLRRLALAQLGSAGVLDDQEFRRRVVEMTIRRVVPVGLRAAAKLNPEHAARLEEAAKRCEVEGTREASQNALAAADAAADDADDAAAAAYYAAYADDAAAAYYAAYADAAADTASAASAADDAAAAYNAAAAAYNAAAAAYYAAAAADAAAADAAAAAARDKSLAEYAEWVVEILIEMNAPGCQWLSLVPLG